jgi:hypothetical protein
MVTLPRRRQGAGGTRLPGGSLTPSHYPGAGARTAGVRHCTALGYGDAMTVAGGARRGLLAGAIGAVVMTAGDRVEQRLTHRPSSPVMGRTLALQLSLSRPEEDRLGRNLAMHYGTGAVAGALRASCQRRTY